jgi:hypothetical protein
MCGAAPPLYHKEVHGVDSLDLEPAKDSVGIFRFLGICPPSGTLKNTASSGEGERRILCWAR